MRAWQHHFAAIFGLEALGRVRGFSPAEMALPNHPDVARAFVRTLADCGYQRVLVQEHTAQQPDGRSICRTGWCAQTRAAAGAPAPGAGTIPAREGPGRLAAVIGERIRPVQRGRRQLDRGSWTNDVSWVRGVRERAGTDAARQHAVQLARCSASTLFSEHLLAPGVPASDPRYRRALFHLLACETSCYRYWARAP
jgi:hypothetical protein